MTERAALHLYGHWDGEPTQPVTDAMFDRRDRHQEWLRAADGDIELDYHVGYVMSAPSPGDTVPSDILIARNPEFDSSGRLINADFRPGDIRKYPFILDHYIAGFRQKRVNGEGLIEEFASGIGIEPGRLMNPWQVQNYGNNKRSAERDILEPSGVALKSYGAILDALDQISDEWGDGEFIFKPDSGALSQGVETLFSLDAVHKAIKSRRIKNNGQIQPYIDLTLPIPHLKALNEAFVDQLRAVNGEADRVREIRMHFFATTIDGVESVEAYPMLRSSKPGTKIMTDWVYTPLDPEAFQQSYPELVEGVERTASKLLEVAKVPHAYGVSDVSIGVSNHMRRRGEPVTFTGDFNVRGPRLPDVSLPGEEITTPAQKAFIRMQKKMAAEAIRLAGE